MKKHILLYIFGFIILSTLVLLNRLFLFFIHLKMKLPTPFPAAKEKKIMLLMKNLTSSKLSYYIDVSFTDIHRIPHDVAFFNIPQFLFYPMTHSLAFLGLKSDRMYPESITGLLHCALLQHTLIISHLFRYMFRGRLEPSIRIRETKLY